MIAFLIRRVIQAIFVVLGVSLAFESASWLVGMRAFRVAKRNRGWWEALLGRDYAAWLKLNYTRR